ncbi:MAG: tol-pal system protein YbgF [Pseudomonadales bacterium]
MIRQGPSLSVLVGCCLLVACAPFVFAASPVSVESRSSDDNASTGPAPDQNRPREIPFEAPVEGDERSSGAGELTYQMQLLQNEVRDLRGRVEQLQHELSRMKSIQEDRYLDLDERFQRLLDRRGGGRPDPDDGDEESPSKRMDLDMPGADIEDIARSVPSGAQSGSGDVSEEKMYESALEMIRNRKYDEAISQLQDTIKQYPEGQYTPNAYYWLGEVYAAKPEPEYASARQALAQVISFFPEHNKAADAAFKLGKVYHLMGDCKRAKDILTQVMEQQRGRSVANLAESYLRDKIDCE